MFGETFYWYKENYPEIYCKIWNNTSPSIFESLTFYSLLYYVTIPRLVNNNKNLSQSQQLPPHATPSIIVILWRILSEREREIFSIVSENWTWRVDTWGCCSIFLKEFWAPTELLIRYWGNSRSATNKQSNESVSPFDCQLLVCFSRVFRGWGWVCGFFPNSQFQ